MALPGKDFAAVKAMNKLERSLYFETHAQYLAEAPVMHYAIRVGSCTLYSNDTYELRKQFDNLMRRRRS